MKVIGILGGAFDPPTLGHALNLSIALNSGKLDEVWLVPSGSRPDKSYNVSDQQRLKMLELLVANCFGSDPRIKVSDIQIKDSSASTTISLHDALKSAHPEDNFRMIIGSELTTDLPNWVESQRLAEEVSFSVIRRAEEECADVDFKMEILEAPREMASFVSSTLARELLAEQKCTAGVLPDAVTQFIRLHNLYGMQNVLDGTKRVFAEGNFTRFVDVDTWEYVERRRCSAVVAVIAMNEKNELILVEQYRVPFKKNVIEFPAGLAGDVEGEEDEQFEQAAIRELEEEAGYRAESMELLTYGPPSSGLSSEVVHFYLAKNITKVSEGGGVDDENIIVHEIPLNEVESWLNQNLQNGKEVDPKIFMALYFLRNKL